MVHVLSSLVYCVLKVCELSTGTEVVYSIVDIPAQADIWGEGPTLFFHPNTDARGYDSVAFFVSDADADSNVARILIDFGGDQADLNGDGAIDLLDFALKQQCFGASENAQCTIAGADLNNDSVIDLRDLCLFVLVMAGPI